MRAFLLSALPLVAPALAQPPTQSAQPPSASQAAPAQPGPIFKDEGLLGLMPDGFKLGWSMQRGPVLMMEFVPKAETVDDWSAMVTQQTMGDMSQRISASTLADGVAGGYARACGVRDATKLATGEVNGYPYELWRMVCPKNPQTQKPEYVHMKLIRGADVIYSVQYAFRAAPTDAQDAKARAYLDKITVCDPRAGDKHPCPPDADYKPVGTSALTNPQ